MIRHKDYLLVTVPEVIEQINARDIELNNSGTKINFWDDVGVLEQELPPGSWQLIGLASELREEQWREIVDWYGAGDGSVDEAGVGDVFWCYDESDFCFDTGIESGFSFLRSHNLNANQVVIVKLK